MFDLKTKARICHIMAIGIVLVIIVIPIFIIDYFYGDKHEEDDT